MIKMKYIYATLLVFLSVVLVAPGVSAQDGFDPSVRNDDVERRRCRCDPARDRRQRQRRRVDGRQRERLEPRQLREDFLVAAHRITDGQQTLRGIVDVGREVAQDGADHVAAGVGFFLGAQAHRDHRDQRRVR